MYGIKGKTELPDLQPKKQESIPEEAKEREEVKLPSLHSKLPPLSRPAAPYPPLPHASQVPQVPPLVHLSPIKTVPSKVLPEVEEDLDQQADGLLKWVEELPEEMSVSSSTHRLPIAL